MIIVTNTYVRPSVNVPFFAMPQQLKSEFAQAYRFTGLAISTTSVLSEDQLTTTVTTKWATRAAFNQFLDDPMSESMRTLRSMYAEANNIQSSSDIKYIPTEGDMDAVPTV